MPVIWLTASMAAANPDAVPMKFRRDRPLRAAQVSTRSPIRSPMWPARKNRVPCSSAVMGPWVVRWYPLQCSNTLNSMGDLLKPLLLPRPDRLVTETESAAARSPPFRLWLRCRVSPELTPSSGDVNRGHHEAAARPVLTGSRDAIRAEA